MSRDDSILLDINGAAARALAFTQGMSEERFLADHKTRWAVYSQIVLIGEAAGRVSAEYKKAHSEVPSRQMIGMRHRLVHGYDDVNWTRVWKTVVHDLPRLQSILAPLLPPLEDPT